MMLHLVPPLGLRCHWTVGTANPLAAAVKVAVAPAATLRLEGCWVMAGFPLLARANVADTAPAALAVTL